MTDLEEADQEEDDGAPQEQSRGRLVRLSLWVDQNKGLVIAFALLAVFVTTAILDVGIPRPVTLVGVAGCAAYIVPGGQVGSQVKKYLPDPPQVVVVDVRAERVQDAKVFLEPLERFGKFECTEGEPARPNPQLAFVRDYDQDEMTYKGTWPGTLTDRELVQHVLRVRECREQLEPMAKAGEQINTNAFIIARSAALSAVDRVRQTFEKGSLPDEGDGITAVIDDALEEFGLSRDDYMTDVLEADEDSVGMANEGFDRVDLDAVMNGPAWNLDGDDLDQRGETDD